MEPRQAPREKEEIMKNPNIIERVKFLTTLLVIFAVAFGFTKLVTHKVEVKVTPYAFVNKILAIEGASADYELVAQLDSKVLNVVLNIDNVDVNKNSVDLIDAFTADCNAKKYDVAILTVVSKGSVVQSGTTGCYEVTI